MMLRVQWFLAHVIQVFSQLGLPRGGGGEITLDTYTLYTDVASWSAQITAHNTNVCLNDKATTKDGHNLTIMII